MGNYEEYKSWGEKVSNEVFQFSQLLCRTVSLSGKEGEMAGILASKMEELGYDEVWTEFNIPTLGYSPGEEIYTHVPDERISLDFISRSILGNAAIAYQLMKD